MKKLYKYLVWCLTWIIFIHSNVAVGSGVLTVVSDSSAPCFRPSLISGLYAGINIGRTWLAFNPHVPPIFGLPSLSESSIRKTVTVFNPVLGYDFYPSTASSFRIEVAYLYSDVAYFLNPMFQVPSDIEFTNDRFLVRNTMGTLYFDWHTCTRLVPFVGVSAGFANLKTYHQPTVLGNLTQETFVYKNTDFSWGGTLGARYFFSSHIYANLQIRFNNLKNLRFKDYSIPTTIVPDNTAYLSDYLHDVSGVVGLGYVF